MKAWWLKIGLSVVMRAVLVTVFLAVGSPTLAYGQAAADDPVASAPVASEQETADEVANPDAGEAGGDSNAGSVDTAGLEADFGNYLHFAVIGRFDTADAHAKALLARPEVSPLSDEAAAALRRLSVEYERSIDTLLILINNSSIGENAQKVLALIREAYRLERMEAGRIMDSIRLLAGTPTQRATGLERLMESGEYAIPEILQVLTNAREKSLHPFVVRALPKLGKAALNPLVESLNIEDNVLQRIVAEALGRIGYPQALPYLKRLAADPQANTVVRGEAEQAVQRILVANPGACDKSSYELFYELAEQYYAEVDSLRPDPREERANVWFARTGALVPVEVPRAIFTMVLCMRCCEASLMLQKDQTNVLALWLAANFRREARLGLDVQSYEPADADDLTRPADFLRSVYFARSAGPRYCQLVLDRAIKDRDRVVALGAIAALRVTAGPAAMTDPAGPALMSLAEALNFPDLLVRIEAALVLGQAMPPNVFRRADEVVPVLASALSLTGKPAYLVVDPDTDLRTKLKDPFERVGAHVVVADRVGAGLAAARKALTHLDAIFLASNIDRPGVVEAMKTITADERFGFSPVVMYVKEGDLLVADLVKQADARVGWVPAGSSGGEQVDESLADQLVAKRDEVAPKFGYRKISPELGLSLAMRSVDTLKRIVAEKSSVFDAGVAQPALIEALGHPSEDMRCACLGVLAMRDDSTAQRALAEVALDDKQTETLRVRALGALAESARRFGHRLDEAQTDSLMQQTLKAPNAALRTAASQALGAMNLPGQQAVQVILSQP